MAVFAGLRNLTAIDPFTSLSPRAQRQLSLLRRAESVPVQWAEFTSLTLTQGLFAEEFIGLEPLGMKLHTMVW